MKNIIFYSIPSIIAELGTYRNMNETDEITLGFFYLAYVASRINIHDSCS